MYEKFFGLAERPFDLTPNPRFLVLTSSHLEVLSNLEYGIASRKGITVLIGEAGSGKTTLIRAAAQRQPARVHTVHLSNPTLLRQEFVEVLAAKFGLSERAAHSKGVFLQELETLLRRRLQVGETTVLIVDEAQSLPTDLLEEIRLLANIETDDVKLLTVVLAGQPELAERLNDRNLRQFKQRVALRCELRPLTIEETRGYVAGRIRIAGGAGAEVFTREAVDVLHEYSQGIPRTVSVIADNALIGGFAAAQKPVGAGIVREVCRDFDLNLDLDDETRASVMPGAETVLAPVAVPAPEPVAIAAPVTGPPAPARAVAPAADQPDASRAGLFQSFTPKRKRFSFFGI